MIAFPQSLADIANKYDAFIIDVWGVILHSNRLYDHAKASLEMLRRKEKQIILLSNVPLRKDYIATMLADLGLEPALYDHLLTSGEACYHDYRLRAEERAAQGLPRERYIELYSTFDRDLLADLPYDRVEDPREADFILGLGVLDAPDQDYRAILTEAHARNIPFLCVNPDHHVPHEGKTLPCVGAITQEYAAMGGTVHYYGKPHPRIYEQALALTTAPKKRILAIGDTIYTDILGANNAGLASLIITGGIIAAKLGASHTQPEILFPHLAALCSQYGCEPNYVLPYLQ
jgi:HAD superfamily hydrolase (TIGR01459 family)